MKRTATLPWLLAVALLGACSASGPPAPAAGGTPAPAVPTEPRPPESAVASAPAASSGGGLYSEAQAGRGRDAFRASCAECHYSSEFRGSQFQFAWRRRTVADLYVEIVRNMPEDAPGSLESQVYVDVVAYILELNGFPPGGGELPADETVLGRYSMAAPGEPDAPRGTS